MLAFKIHLEINYFPADSERNLMVASWHRKVFVWRWKVAKRASELLLVCLFVMKNLICWGILSFTYNKIRILQTAYCVENLVWKPCSIRIDMIFIYMYMYRENQCLITKAAPNCRTAQAHIEVKTANASCLLATWNSVKCLSIHEYSDHHDITIPNPTSWSIGKVLSKHP